MNGLFPIVVRNILSWYGCVVLEHCEVIVIIDMTFMLTIQRYTCWCLMGSMVYTNCSINTCRWYMCVTMKST